MKKTVAGSWIALLILLPGCSPERPPVEIDPNLPATTVRVIVTGARHDGGRLRLALYDSPDGFPGEPERALRRLDTLFEGDGASFTLEDVAPGRYAVSVLHDENDNGEMETGLFGQPAEGYGFSNDARGRMGAPSFDSATFTVVGEPVTLVVRLAY